MHIAGRSALLIAGPGALFFGRRRRDPVIAVFALLLIGVYFFATWSTHREQEHRKDIAALHRQIVAFVAQHPRANPFTLEALKDAGGINDDDVEFMRQNDITYQPVNAQSPGAALVLVEHAADVERYYYKDGTTDFAMKFRSPNGLFSLVNGPAPHGPATGRSLQVMEEASGKMLGNFAVDGSSITAQWSPNNSFVAVNRSLRGGLRRLTVLAVGPAGAKELKLPDELAPERLLPKDDAAGGIHWYANQIYWQNWRSDRELIVENYGGATLGEPRARPPRTVNLRYRFVLRIDDQGNMHVVETTRTALNRTK